MYVAAYLEMVTSSFLALPPPCLDPGGIIYVLLSSLGQGRWQFASVFRQQLTLQRAGKQLGIKVLW